MPTSIKVTMGEIPLARDLWRVAENGEIAQLHELLARGADVNSSNDAGVTALMIAAHHGRLEMVRALTDRGADVNQIDRDGFTAATLAQRAGYEDIVRTLVARGAKPPKQIVTSSAADGPALDETLRTSSAADMTSARSQPAVAPLPGPPNIWDVVHEAPVEFDPKSAFVGHLPPLNIIGLSVIALILVGAAVFAFVKLNGGSLSPPAASMRTPTNNAANVPTPATPQSDNTSAEQRSSPATEPNETQTPATQSTETAADDGRLVAGAKKSKPGVVANGQPDKRPVSSPLQPDERSLSSGGNTTPFGAGKQINTDKTGQKTTTPPKFDISLPQPTREKSNDANESRKSAEKKDPDKVQSPSPVRPARPSPTPN
jgi:hypothetical protein